MVLTNYKHPQIFVKQTCCQHGNVWLVTLGKCSYNNLIIVVILLTSDYFINAVYCILWAKLALEPSDLL